MSRFSHVGVLSPLYSAKMYSKITNVSLCKWLKVRRFESENALKRLAARLAGGAYRGTGHGRDTGEEGVRHKGGVWERENLARRSFLKVGAYGVCRSSEKVGRWTHDSEVKGSGFCFLCLSHNTCLILSTGRHVIYLPCTIESFHCIHNVYLGVVQAQLKHIHRDKLIISKSRLSANALLFSNVAYYWLCNIPHVIIIITASMFWV